MRYPERPTVRRGGDYGARIERLVTWLRTTSTNHQGASGRTPRSEAKLGFYLFQKKKNLIKDESLKNVPLP